MPTLDKCPLDPDSEPEPDPDPNPEPDPDPDPEPKPDPDPDPYPWRKPFTPNLLDRGVTRKGAGSQLCE